MANDATGKSTSNSDPLESNSLSNAGDQQKVPPLRIVLNSAGNQKSTSTTTGNQQSKRDARQESTLKTSGRVRIKLGASRQQSGKTTNSDTNETNVRSERQKATDKQLENINEDSTSSFTHLRRITRRSQRTVQSISNEDEESISSMTSIDENLNNTNSIQTNSDTVHDQDQSNSATAASSTAANANNGSSNTDTPRRYKRKKFDSSESQSLECDSLLGTQNYRLPHQNSFELFRNIRKQVDKKLKSLTFIHPKVPYGFRDYMLSRGTYLLDGNKLGNGTNLFVNEQGGLEPGPVGKYHFIKQGRMNYTVPNRTKVPLGLPVNSPLYDLFIEQEKERFRMRMQHIKEREKLTLASEQEFMRVYNKAALAAANQTETFSVCTMLKHQEMYNYLDSDGLTILSREDAQQDQVEQQDGVRTRRRQHGPISPVPTRKGSNTEEPIAVDDKAKKETETSVSSEEKRADVGKATCQTEKDTRDQEAASGNEPSAAATSALEATIDRVEDTIQTENLDSKITLKVTEESASKEKSEIDEKQADMDSKSPSDVKTDSNVEKLIASSSQNSPPTEAPKSNERSKKQTATDETDEPESVADQKSLKVVTEEEKNAINKDKFLVDLQVTDDKWDKIRHELLVRHNNEAESLHAIQKLEWEWKTKEIGACDVRTTVLIDNSLVPKLDIYSQDY